MRALRSMGIIVLVTLVLLLGCEASARVIGWHLPEEAAVVGGFGFSASGSGDLLPNLNSLETVYALRPYRLVTNSVGLRNTQELNDDPSVTRILAIGDSFTYGFYVHNEETTPSRLQELLEQSQTGRYQVLNAGIPGYTLTDELAYLTEKGLALNPDLVILGFYTNDIFDYLPTMRQYFAREIMLPGGTSGTTVTQQSKPAAWLRQNSALYNGLLGISGRLNSASIAQQVANVTPTIEGLEGIYHDSVFLNPDSAANQAYWQAYTRDFVALVDILRAREIPLILVAYPDLNQMPQNGMGTYPQTFLSALTTAQQVPLVDMLPIFRTQGDIQSLYLMYYDRDKPVNAAAPDASVQAYTGDGHLSMYGHLTTARALLPVVLEALGQ